MGKAYRYILFLAIVVTATIFIHEWLYDIPSQPYTLQQTILEILVFGTICTAIIFGAVSGIYFITGKLVKALR